MEFKVSYAREGKTKSVAIFNSLGEAINHAANGIINILPLVSYEIISKDPFWVKIESGKRYVIYGIAQNNNFLKNIGEGDFYVSLITYSKNGILAHSKLLSEIVDFCRVNFFQAVAAAYECFVVCASSKYPKITIYSNGEFKSVNISQEFYSYLEEYLKDEDIDLNSGYLLQDHFDIYVDDYRKATGNDPIIH